MYVLLALVAVVLNIYLAKKKNQSVIAWMFLGLILPLLSTIVLFFMKPKVQEMPPRVSSLVTWIVGLLFFGFVVFMAMHIM
jgi:FtsH-binding integral membrane protein